MAQKLLDSMLITIPRGKMTLEEGKLNFIDHCEAKNLRPRSIENYLHAIDRFLAFYDLHFPGYTMCGNVVKKDVESYSFYLKNTIGMAETSVNSYLRNLRSFLYYLMEEEEATMPFKVKLIKANKPMKKTYSDTELRMLLQRPRMKSASFTEYRNWVIVNFLLATGVRASTLINVRAMDVDFDNDFITLDYTKSGKSYRIPMDIELKGILLEYLDVVDVHGIEPLFTKEDFSSLSYEGLKTAIERYCDSRSVENKGLHTFRHTFAKMAVMNGMDVFTLQKMLGHADLSTSRLYVEMFSEDIKHNFESYSPLGNLLRSKPKTAAKRKVRKIDMSKLK